jgi:hypothetical protein
LDFGALGYYFGMPFYGPRVFGLSFTDHDSTVRGSSVIVIDSGVEKAVRLILCHWRSIPTSIPIPYCSKSDVSSVILSRYIPTPMAIRTAPLTRETTPKY